MGAWIDELDSTRIPGCLDVVDSAPEAAGMDMGPVELPGGLMIDHMVPILSR